MPQLIVNSSNIDTFLFTVTFDLKNRYVTADFSGTTYNGSGIDNVLGISLGLEDQDGVVLATIDFTNPVNYIVPSVTQELVVDLSSVNYAFLFQTYKITAAIQDGDGTIYTTTPVYSKVCQPVGFNDFGYVPGMFTIGADCVNNSLTVKEITALVYNNTVPVSVTKDGELSYPTGTISPIEFSGTPWSNNVVYTGQYRINCDTVATYSLGNDVYVEVTYTTNNVFDITCSNKMADLVCCIVSIQETAIKQCNTAVGKQAQQQMADIAVPLMTGLIKEINGQDASAQADYIKKYLRCDCGIKSVSQNEVTPINPSIYNIVLQGVGGTTVPAATVIGNTKTYNIASNVYQVVKGNPSDLSFTITLDTSVSNTVKYVITFNYDVLAASIYTATANNPTLLNQLNQLVSASGADLSGLDGKCVIDLSQVDYAVSQSVTGSTLVTQVVINGNIYTAPGSLFANNASGVQSWLNSLTLGTFSAVFNSGTLTIISANNTNVVSTISFSSPTETKQFAATNATLVEILQACIDYLCQLTALQIALGANLSLCRFDSNGNIIVTSYPSEQNQAVYNSGISVAICNIVQRINTIATTTCATIKSIFQDNALSVFTGNGRVYGIDSSGNCVAFTPAQIATGVISIINSSQTVKDLFCAINCSDPADCPDVSNFSLAMSAANLGIYSLTWSTTPSGNQTVTVRYKLIASGSYTVATTTLQVDSAGNLVGSVPYEISGVTPGQTYDVQITNNCGGAGIVKQITVPTGEVYSGLFRLDNAIYNICGEDPVTLYSGTPFGSGTVMYTDSELTILVTGFIYIADASGTIYNLNSGTGVVGSTTGTSCDNNIIEWSFDEEGAEGQLEIEINSVDEVLVTATDAGNFTSSTGDTIDVTLSGAGATTKHLQVIDTSTATVLYNNISSSTESYSFVTLAGHSYSVLSSIAP